MANGTGDAVIKGLEKLHKIVTQMLDPNPNVRALVPERFYAIAGTMGVDFRDITWSLGNVQLKPSKEGTKSLKRENDELRRRIESQEATLADADRKIRALQKAAEALAAKVAEYEAAEAARQAEAERLHAAKMERKAAASATRQRAAERRAEKRAQAEETKRELEQLRGENATLRDRVAAKVAAHPLVNALKRAVIKLAPSVAAKMSPGQVTRRLKVLGLSAASLRDWGVAGPALPDWLIALLTALPASELASQAL